MTLLHLEPLPPHTTKGEILNLLYTPGGLRHKATPPKFRHFFAGPSQVARPRWGYVVNLRLYALKTGQAIKMPGGDDASFGGRSAVCFRIVIYSARDGGAPDY